MGVVVAAFQDAGLMTSPMRDFLRWIWTRHRGSGRPPLLFEQIVILTCTGEHKGLPRVEETIDGGEAGMVASNLEDSREPQEVQGGPACLENQTMRRDEERRFTRRAEVSTMRQEHRSRNVWEQNATGTREGWTRVACVGNAEQRWFCVLARVRLPQG